MELSIKSRTSSTDIESIEGRTISLDAPQDKQSAYSTIKKDEDTERYHSSVITPSPFLKNPIDKDNQRFPFCIVWTPIPGITTILPFIGHTGICTSSGVIHDFAGSYYVSVDNMGFGSPCKYVELNPSEQEMAYWDKAVEKGDERYNSEQHNLFTNHSNNCHSHCAYVLNLCQYQNRSNYTMVHVWWMLTTQSKYVSWGHLLKSYIGFIVFALIVVLMVYAMR